MKQFNLEEYLRLKEEGREPKIVTREGIPVRILRTDRNHYTFPIVGLFEDGSIESFTTKGLFTYGVDSRNDLFFAPIL